MTGMTDMKSRPQTGFTLVEMAIVLAVIGLILGATLTVLTALQEQRNIEDTKSSLEAAKDALLGFAVTNGRLPCPASSTSNGIEDPVGGTTSLISCTHPYDGFLPAATLGLPNVDDHGYLQDAWHIAANRVRYAVTIANTRAATTTDGIKTLGMGSFTPNLYVCDTASGITSSSCGTATTLTSQAVAIIYTLGPNAPNGGTGTDEAANLNADPVFVSHTVAYAKDSPANGEFDDQLLWLSPYTLFNRMVQAGKLP
ncbi:MAG: prepilin-type N-terminal cleavage/methylation domain-containing protein [Gallionella sp.]|nr:prepilin-type N-terminal cleavage/methylation domain-containing protein [Gallionella sp.]